MAPLRSLFRPCQIADPYVFIVRSPCVVIERPPRLAVVRRGIEDVAPGPNRLALYRASPGWLGYDVRGSSTEVALFIDLRGSGTITSSRTSFASTHLRQDGVILRAA